LTLDTATYKELRSYAHRIAKDKFLGDELLHDTLSYILENGKINTLNEQGTLIYYMRVAIWRAYTLPSSPFKKKHLGRSVTITDKIMHDLETGYPWIGSRLDNETIHSAIRQLPEFERSVINLWAFHGFSYEELSKQSEIPIKDLYSAVEKSKKILRKCLHKE